MKNKRPSDIRQVSSFTNEDETTEQLTTVARHRQALAQIFGAGKSPRIEELVSYTDASQAYGVPTHQLQYAAARGELLAVPLPNGKTALHEVQLRQWLGSNKRPK